MKLYEAWLSSASWRVRWALALKKVAYESVLLNLDAGEHHTVLATVNPMHQVPTLQLDDGRVLTESVAIVEWLDETHPEPPLLPGDPMGRARVRELVQIVNSGVHPLQNSVVRRAISADRQAQAVWSAKWIERGLTGYEAQIGDRAGRFSVGDRLSMADLFLVPQVRNAERHGADISGCVRVREIYETCMATPEARATDPSEVKKQLTR